MNTQGIGRGAPSAALCALLLGSCGGDGGTSTLSLSLTDAPLENVSKVWLQFTGVEIKPANGEPEEILFDLPQGYDLLTLQNGNAATLLGDTTVDAGTYEWVRLMLDPAPGSSYVIDDSGQHDLEIPSGFQTGLKLVRGFTMPAGGRADFTIDFDLHKSIIAPPGQSPDYRMKPVLRMTNNVETGAIGGTFTTTPAPCADAAPMLYLYSGANVVPDDIYNPADSSTDTAPEVDPLTTALAFRNGSGQWEYRFGFVQTGTYTLAYTCDDDDPLVDENSTTPLVFVSFAAPISVSAGQTATANF
jgi:hypothetical protein